MRSGHYIRGSCMGKPSYKEFMRVISITQGFSKWGGHYIRILSMGKPLYNEALREEPQYIRAPYMRKPFYKESLCGKAIIRILFIGRQLRKDFLRKLIVYGTFFVLASPRLSYTPRHQGHHDCTQVSIYIAEYLYL